MSQDRTSDLRPTISTHVLDTERGVPARGIPVTLYRLEDERAQRMTQALTDGDGRVRDLLERPLQAGDYRLEFAVGSPGGHARDEDAPVQPFFTRVTVDLRVVDTRRSYHIPLLISSYSLTTYRGS